MFENIPSDKKQIEKEIEDCCVRIRKVALSRNASDEEKDAVIDACLKQALLLQDTLNLM